MSVPSKRRVLIFVLVAGGVIALIPVVYLSSLVVWGSTLTPPPTPSPIATTTLFKDALWAHAGGGRATELRSVNPINLAGLMICSNLAGGGDDPQRLDSESLAECAKWLPAMQGIEYLSRLHGEDHQIPRASFRGGASSMATILRMSRSWTREELLNTLAARVDFGYGWHGVDAAARGYFNKTPDQLALHEAALIASMAGERYLQPWCHPGAMTESRNRTLERMRDNGAIAEADFRIAAALPLGLAPPPEKRPPCRE
jgi:transglycosylase-like protein